MRKVVHDIDYAAEFETRLFKLRQDYVVEYANLDYPRTNQASGFQLKINDSNPFAWDVKWGQLHTMRNLKCHLRIGGKQSSVSDD